MESEASANSTIARGRAEFKREVSFWKEVLKSLLQAVLFLAKNNLAFRGTTDKLFDRRCGNYLSLIELLSQYHPPLALHINRLEKGSVSYLSPLIQNEFISLAAGSVRHHITNKIRQRKYFSIFFDATPDCSHKEQISQVVRSVSVSESDCKVEEHFIDFIHFENKTGAEISSMVLAQLKEDGLDIENCRGQGYDNGANMSGIYNGVQAHIKDKNPLANFVPCAAHSLNLVGQNAAANVLPAKLILGQVQNLFVFFSSSTKRWNVLTTHVKKSLQSQSVTRWSSKFDAVHAIFEEFEHVLDALNHLINSDMTNAQTMADASSHLGQVGNFRFLLGITVWNSILSRIHVTNVALQKVETDIDQAAKHIQGLLTWLTEFKSSGFSNCLEKAQTISSSLGIDLDSGFQQRHTRGRVPARFRDADVQPPLVQQTNLEKFEAEFFTALLAKLVSEFGNRFQMIKETSATFAFLWGKSLACSTDDELSKRSLELASKYPGDFDTGMFAKEIGFLRSAVAPFLPERTKLEETTPLDILKILTINKLQYQFANCHTAIRIFLTLPVTVAGNERAFSKLKIIKNYRRSSMAQERASNLGILSIEYEQLSEISFDSIIDAFASAKCRKVPIKVNV